MKERLLILTALFLFAGNVCFAQKYDNKAANLKGKKILLFTKNGKGYIHDNIPASIEMFFKLSSTEHFQLDTTTNSSIFASEELQKYHVVVFSNTNNEVFDTPEERDGFVKYIRSGKGFVGIHSACGTEREWDWFKQMLGCTFDFHPPMQEFPVKVVDASHPSTKNQPLVRTVKDELYFMKEINPTVRILMVSDFSSPDYKSSKPMPHTYGKVFPCVWCNDFDGGRQWYTALGHAPSDYSDPDYVDHILGGLKWVVR
ncbi:MAG: ThuA domain-containing protein [Dysgonamonadaceae bacterium]|jgi:type 1 glutamine amidotransferase|nr:ThuA domain-containing protein [Dysgonamonadaceae bacterium]